MQQNFLHKNYKDYNLHIFKKKEMQQKNIKTDLFTFQYDINT